MNLLDAIATPSIRGLPETGWTTNARDAQGANHPDRLTETEKLERVAREFEGVLLRTLVRQMRATVPEDGLLPKNSGQKLFEEMMDDSMASALSAGMGLGIAEALVRQLNPALRGDERGQSG